jgi:TonB-linked SusC/RagA family outer membrane protein
MLFCFKNKFNYYIYTIRCLKFIKSTTLTNIYLTNSYFMKKKLMKEKLHHKLFLLAFFVVSTVALGQTNKYSFSGSVTDGGNGQPIPGASVFVENTSFGAVSDFDGNYDFGANLASGDYTLVISYLGYSTKKIKITPTSGSTIENNVSLNEDLLSLDEVIVTGNSGNTSRRQLGNAIGSIKGEAIKNTGSNNALASISGKVLGAQVTQNSGEPGGGFSVRLRGVSTINGSSEPLYIVDGVIVNNSSQNVINLNADAMGTSFQSGQNRLVDLNPNDIESIEVLNGASAAAIYGSLASNGVVQIITKKGKSGEAKITFSNSTMVSYLRKRLEFNDFGQRFGIAGNDRLTTVGDRLTQIANLRPDRGVNPGTGPNGLGGPLDVTTYDVTRYDYQDDIFRTAYGTENYFSITGGNDKTNYFFSSSYNRNQGIIDNTFFQKYGGRLTVTQELTDKLNLTAGLTYNNSASMDQPNGNNFFSPISAMIIIDNVYDVNERDELGNLLGVERTRLNPLTSIETYNITQETDRIIGSLQMNYNPIDNLDFRYNFGIDSYSLKGNTFQPRVAYAAETQVNAAFFPDGYASVATSTVANRSNDFAATYKLDVNDKITATTTLGGQYLYTSIENTRAEGRDLQDFISTINGAKNFFSNPSEARSEFSVWGYYLQENLSFNDIFYVTLAGRFDGASSFSKDQRNQFYPKVSSSFIMSDMDFWKDSGAWNTLKLRASYGEAGNLTSIGPFSRFTNANPVLLGPFGGFVPSGSLGDENISPERMKEFEIGADLSFFNNRLAIQGTYYRQNIEDLILNVGIAPSEGGASILTNVGTMTNNGIELLVSAVPFKTKNFSWDTSFSYSTFNNEVNGIGNGRAGVLLRGGGGTQSAIDGEGLGVFFANYYARNTDGSLLLDIAGLPQIERGNDVTGVIARNANGQPVGDPLRKVLGDPNPEYSASFINEFTFKKITLRMQFDALGGFDVYNWNKITSNNVGNGLMAERELRGELPRGWTAAVGGFRGPRIQEEHVENGSFIKLREFLISYDLGDVAFTKNLNVSLIGRNLFSLDNYSGYDPETNSAGQSNSVRGDDFGNFPIPASVQFRLTASF